MTLWVLVVLVASAMGACSSNCSGSPCVDDVCECAYPSNASDCSSQWAEGSRRSLLIAFVVVFALLFGGILVASAVQGARWIYLAGWRPNVPKLLHGVIFGQAVLRIGWILSAGLDVLAHKPLRGVLEGVVDGLGIAALIVCYLLCILLWLQVLNQISPSGAVRSFCVRFRSPVVAALIVLYLVVEISVRLVWNISTNPSVIFAAIAVYHVVVLMATLLCSAAFIVISVQLYRLLRESSVRNPMARQRMQGMMRFATFTLIISLLTLLASLVFFTVEVFRYSWRNWDAWLIEQAFMRSLEATYSIGVLWFLRSVPPHEVRPERRGLLSPQSGRSAPTNSTSSSIEHDALSESNVRRKLSLDPSDVVDF